MLVDIYEKIQEENKKLDKKKFIIKTTSPTQMLSGGKTTTMIVR
jgi:hypothetical protein